MGYYGKFRVVRLESKINEKNFHKTKTYNLMIIMHNESNFQLNNLFDKFIQNPPIIKHHRMLSHSFLPESYPHRTNQMENIGSILANVLRDHRPSNMFLYGKLVKRV